MIRNYLLVALRNIRKHSLYSAINIFGLSVGIISCMLIMTYVQFELSFDNFNEKGDRVFRVFMDADFGSGTQEKIAVTPNIVAPTLQAEFPEIEHAVRVYNPGRFRPYIVKVGEEVYQEPGVYYADSAFFDVFTFQALAGDLQKSLVRPQTVVLTESYAQKYFGSTDVVGKTLLFNNTTDYEVTAVVNDVPDNAHFHFDMIGSFSSLGWYRSENLQWGSANFFTYVLLENKDGAQELEDKMSVLLEDRMGENMRAGGFWIDLRLENLFDIYLSTEAQGGPEPTSDIIYVVLFSSIAILILVIACINYMNLATARASDRAKEVGMRKMLGAKKKELFYQFIGESGLVTFVALLLAVVFVEFLMPGFSALTERNLSIDYIANPIIIVGLISLWITVSLLAGAYPAIVISGFSPSKVLKGSFKTSAVGNVLRKILVTIQFGASMFLIIATMVVFKQLAFIQNKKLGYDKDHVIAIPLDRQIVQRLETFKSVLNANQNIHVVTASSETPTSVRGGYSFTVEGMPKNESVETQALAVDIEFVKTLGIEIVAGSDYTPASAEGETHSFIVNESTARDMGLEPEQTLGKRISLNGRDGFITGVMKDFHFASMHRAISPLVLFLEPGQFNYLLVKTSGDNVGETLGFMKNQWKELVPYRPFEYKFLDDEYGELYKAEQKVGGIYGIFAFLAILIACLGLFGLASYTAVQRAKEISVRKVLGSSVFGVVSLLSRDFGKLVAISFVLAAPLSYYFMQQWLQEFAYQVGVGADVLLVAGIASFLIAWLTVSYHAFKAATSNPVNTLRHE